jgi:hypothetical protein
MHMKSERLVLTYRICIGSSDWEHITEPVLIIRVSRRFGGSRPYFLCPAVVNNITGNRHVTRLYGALLAAQSSSSPSGFGL